MNDGIVKSSRAPVPHIVEPPNVKIFSAAGSDVVEVVALDLIRTPSGPCIWRVHTTGATIHYEVTDRVAKVAA